MDYRPSDKKHDFLRCKKQLTILFTIIAIGWIYSFLNVVSFTPGMSFSQFGPGMNTINFLSSQPQTAMSDLISLIPLCSNFASPWTIENLSGSMLMWFGMVMAMMVPTLVIPGIVRPINTNGFMIFLIGYFCIWLIFCILGVVIQWALQAYGLLDNSLVITNSSASAMIFLIIGSVQLLKPKLTSMPRWPKISAITQSNIASLSNGFSAGLIRGSICVYSCFPFMFVMFVFGLMNLVAMAFLTIIMYLMVNFTTGLITRGTGLALIVSGVFLLGSKYT